MSVDLSIIPQHLLPKEHVQKYIHSILTVHNVVLNGDMYISPHSSTIKLQKMNHRSIEIKN